MFRMEMIGDAFSRSQSLIVALISTIAFLPSKQNQYGLPLGSLLSVVVPSFVFCFALCKGDFPSTISFHPHDKNDRSSANPSLFGFHFLLPKQKSDPLLYAKNSRCAVNIFWQLDTSNILFLYPFFSPLKSSGRRSCIICRHFLLFIIIKKLPFSSIPLLYTYNLFYFIHVCKQSNHCEQYVLN